MVYSLFCLTFHSTKCFWNLSTLSVAVLCSFSFLYNISLQDCTTIYLFICVGYIHESGIVFSQVCICSYLVDTARQFSRVTLSSYAHTGSIGEFWLYRVLGNTCIICFFPFSPYSKYIMISYCVFDFPNDVRHSVHFHVIIGHLEMTKFFASSLLCYLSFSYWFSRVLHIFWKQVLVAYMYRKCFLSLARFFALLIVSLEEQKCLVLM